MGEIRRSRRLLTASAIVMGLAVAGGCGGGTKDGANRSAATKTAASPTAGMSTERTMFHMSCGACHMLADADAHGTGAGGEANLDAIRPNSSSLENYITHGFGKMPSFRTVYSSAQIKALARYVAIADGCGVKSPTGCDN